jgi:hypothetical protein
MLSLEDNELGFDMGGTPKPPLKGVPERLIKHQEWFDHAEP